ncbi:CNH-domain-containing [Pyrrhoderma noxium]|uniref:CNH-domain-containing n=1 Tax=Pyrrhoderma noxium TaxID=2282107 RepID=A0A286UL27_9AGAM|nr:CNH-domain-containing [Pyrrhoderma noxium]
MTSPWEGRGKLPATVCCGEILRFDRTTTTTTTELLTMDRALGAHPDKRTAAYESIFGRPSASHHQYQRPPPQSTVTYAQGYHQHTEYAAQNYYYQQQQYDPRYDAQVAYAQAVQQTYPQQSYSPSYRQQAYYVQQQQQQQQMQLQQQQQQQQQQQYAMYNQPHQVQHNNLAPPDHYARSLASSSRSAGIIAPQPSIHEQIAPGTEAMVREGMTPAQAYQAQVYSSNYSNYPSPNVGPGQLVSTTLQESRSQRNARNSGQGPQILLGIEPPDSRLDLDFLTEGGYEAKRAEVEGGGTGLGRSASSSTSPQSSQDYRYSDGSLDYHGVVGPSSRPYPLQLDTALNVGSSTLETHSPASSTYVDHLSPAPSSTYVDHVSPAPSSPRLSGESTRTLPKHMNSKRERTFQDRSRSIQSRRTPIVYPALLSRVAEAFRERITLSERVKDGLTYSDCFDGREAVDKIAYIIKTTDRNLALLLGRALDAQKFFHDVTYDHRLRDSPYELFQFRTAMPTPFVSGEVSTVHGDHNGQIRPSLNQMDSAITGSSRTDSTTGGPNATTMSADEAPLPSGVFTLLTDCYSPTCSRDSLCYSIACPRRLEQQARLNMKPQPGLKRSISKESLGDPVEPGTLWIHSVPKEIVDSVSDTEKKRQEAINEVIYTERDFVRDMEYLRDVWIAPLKKSEIIPEHRRLDFLEQVFWNIHDIIAVNGKLRDALNRRQKSFAIVERIGDVFSEMVPQFAPFVSYGSHQLYGKYEFEKEKSSNPEFQKFVDETERRPESRKLELNGYLTKPTTRLARYPLLLGVVLKYTPDDNPDKEELPKVIALVKEFLDKVNIESGKTENRFSLLQLNEQLVFRPGEEVDLRLKDEGRELVFKGNLKRRGGQGDNGDLQVFLFDHALLMVKQKDKHKHEQYKVYRRPIPLELLLVSAPDETTGQTSRPSGKSQAKTLTKKNSFTKNQPPAAPAIAVPKSSKDGFSITFVHLGRHYYQLTLWASTQVNRRKWLEVIQKQQEAMRERSLVFDTVTLSEGFFVGASNRVNCAAPFDHGRRVAYGTNDGVYFSNLRDPSRHPVRVLGISDVTQIDVLEEYQLLIVLSEHSVMTFPLEALSEHDPAGGLRRAKRISSHTSFFKAGVCLGRTLVCVVKASQLSSTIKALEPIEFAVRGKNKPTFKKLIQGGNDTLRLFREFYIPVESSSIHYLKTKLCVGCTKGFEIVDLETLDTQALLDPSDVSLDFVQKREDVRPMSIYRIKDDFLLCYDEFAFYVNKSGWRARPNFMIHWEGHPRSFALHYPYVLAFEPTFVEIRHVETGVLTQIIQGNNLRCLYAEAPPSTTHVKSNVYPGQNGHMPNSYGYDPRQTYGQPMNAGASQYGLGNREIIMVSDDRVMVIQLAQHTS